MMKFVKKNIDIIIVVLILIILILLNANPDKITMGLDNSSPYFEPFLILDRIKGTSSVVYGGLVFQLPFLGILNKLGVSPELLSNIYVFSNFILGTLGISLLLKKHFKENYITVIGTVIFLTNLFVFWIFGNPNFLFIASFGSIPLIIYLLSSNNLNWYQYILLALLSISFLTTTLNIVAFVIYSILIIFLTLIFTKDKKPTCKKLFIWSIAILLTWIGSIQILMIKNNDKTFFPLRIYEYTQELLDNPYIDSTTEGIIASEKTNSLTRTMSFALGWMELHDSSNTPIFEKYSTYRENLFYTILGLIPYMLAILAVFLKKDKKTILLTICLLSFTFVSSRYGISIIEKIPYINSSLRWASSKLWPIYIIPLVILSSLTLNELTKKKTLFTQALIISLITIFLIIYALPVLNGHLLSSKTLVNIPKEYFEIPSDSKILILPHSQKSYMREYDWGYYGSDFLVHITNSEIVDGANLFEYGEEYEDIFKSKEIPEDIEYVIYDNSAEGNLDNDLKKESQQLLNGLVLINSNQYFETYGR